MRATAATRAPATERLAGALGAAAAAPVMGTGIVSVALALDGETAAADALLAVALALAVVLLAVLAVTAVRDPRRLERAAARPASLTVVAALCVLGARLTQAGSRTAGAVLLGLAVLTFVFPVGMYAAMSHAGGVADGHDWMVGFARDWTWVALVVWALVAGAAVRRGVRLLP